MAISISRPNFSEDDFLINKDSIISCDNYITKMDIISYQIENL